MVSAHGQPWNSGDLHAPETEDRWLKVLSWQTYLSLCAWKNP